MTGRWTERGDKPADHGTDCVCPGCWTRLEAITGTAPNPTPLLWADTCTAHGEILNFGAGCSICGGGAA